MDKKYTAEEFIRHYHNWYETVKPYSPDPVFEVFDIINNPRPEDELFIKRVNWFNKIIRERLKINE